jgi:hypothetical protein
MVSVSVDPPQVEAAFRAGLGARWTFLSDEKRRYLHEFDLLETTDSNHDPYVPTVFTLFPDLRIHRVYNGYWFWGRPTLEELRHDLREISHEIRENLVSTAAQRMSPPYAWLALRDERPSDALAAAEIDGGGWLVAWDGERDEPDGAWRCDPRLIDPHGDAAKVALAVAPRGVSLHFDDPAVSGALRMALASEPARILTTLVVEEVDYAGALVSPTFLVTPFDRIFPSRTLRVGAGLLGRTPWPTGPVIARYAPGSVWPYDRF